MKAILEFNLPEDKVDFDLALQGSDWKHVCWEMDQYLRKELKYSDDKSFEELKLLQEVRDEFWKFMNENNVDLYAAE
jgi:hypothetical protein